MNQLDLGRLLVKDGFMTELDRRTIKRSCGHDSAAFAKSILSIGLLDEDELAAFLAENTRYEIAPKNFLSNMQADALTSVDMHMLAHLEVIPLKITDKALTVAMVDPLDRTVTSQLEFFTGLEVKPIIAPLSQIHRGLRTMIPHFEPPVTPLDKFLVNHASSAWRLQKLKDPNVNFDKLKGPPDKGPNQSHHQTTPVDFPNKFTGNSAQDEEIEVEENLSIDESTGDEAQATELTEADDIDLDGLENLDDFDQSGQSSDSAESGLENLDDFNALENIHQDLENGIENLDSEDMIKGLAEPEENDTIEDLSDGIPSADIAMDPDSDPPNANGEDHHDPDLSLEEKITEPTAHSGADPFSSIPESEPERTNDREPALDRQEDELNHIPTNNPDQTINLELAKDETHHNSNHDASWANLMVVTNKAILESALGNRTFTLEEVINICLLSFQSCLFIDKRTMQIVGSSFPSINEGHRITSDGFDTIDLFSWQSDVILTDTEWTDLPGLEKEGSWEAFAFDANDHGHLLFLGSNPHDFGSTEAIKNIIGNFLQKISHHLTIPPTE